MSTYGIAAICSNLEIASGIWQMELYEPQIATKAIPGQFINAPEIFLWRISASLVQLLFDKLKNDFFTVHHLRCCHTKFSDFAIHRLIIHGVKFASQLDGLFYDNLIIIL